MLNVGGTAPREFVKGFSRSLKIAVYTGFVAGFVSILLPNNYRSESRLLPMQNSSGSGLGSLAAAAAGLGVGLGIPGASDANFVDILDSRWLGEKLLMTNFRFRTRTWWFGKESVHQESLYDYLDEPNVDRALKALDKTMSVTRDFKTNIILLTAETRSPELSQQILHRATELLNIFVVENARTQGSEKAAFSGARLEDARKELDKAEKAFREFLESNRNYQMSLDPEVRLRGARLEAELSLRRQLMVTLAMNREQALLDAKNDIPIINVLDPGNLPIEKSGPPRGLIVLLSMLLAGLGNWTWMYREWVRERLFGDGR